MSARLAVFGMAFLCGCTTPSPAPLADAAPAQRAWAAACSDTDDWDKPGPPFRIFGNTYYVGTCGITSLLIDGPDGLVVIDSGTDKGAQIVLDNIRTLGFDPHKVTTLLMTHEHFDHIGGMARLQAATGATIVATPAAAAVLRSGSVAADDPQAKSGHPPFPAVTGTIAIMNVAQPQRSGGVSIEPMFTPGHTHGATSWRWNSCEGSDCKSIVYVDSLNPISSDGYRFSDHPQYLAAFRAGIAKVAAAQCDIVLAPHPSAAAMRLRLNGERPLVDREGCRAYAAAVTARLDKRLADENAGG